MNIRIESLTANGLGPIASIKWQFKDINLIYGRNEQGKTFLAEYLLASLFRSIKSTRPLTESGQVILTGLTSQAARLDPKSKKKLEDYLFQGGEERPVDLARLLVVRGGELSFTGSPEKPLSRDILRDYLSDQRTLDAIIKGIPATVQESTWENGQIIGKKHTGAIKELSNTRQAVQRIADLLQEISENYFPGEISKLKSQLDETNHILSVQHAARRCYAFSLAQYIKSLESELGSLPRQDLDELKDILSRLESKLESARAMQAEKSALEPQVRDYPWLVTAIDECEKRPAAFAGSLAVLFALLAALGIIAVVVFAFLEQPYTSLAAGLLALLFFALAILQVRARLAGKTDLDEVERIFAEFERKFGEPARSIASLSTTYEALRPKFERISFLDDQVKGTQSDISYLRQTLNYRLEILTGRNPGTQDPARLVSSLQKKHDQLTERLGSLRAELAGTNVREEDYLAEALDTPYDPDLLRTQEQLKAALQEDLAGMQHKLDSLKQRVCDVTGDGITADWDSLIEHLRDKRQETNQAARALKAEVGSGILVSQVISEFRRREDETISQALASPAIRQAIQAVSRTYRSVELEGSEIIACSEHQRFPLDSLSTGAREQLLLALRIGIAAHLLKERKMFLILDDAFQHSDWQRREWLVDEIASLVQVGWQVIYFTMDDHIRQLFEQRIQPAFPDRYQSFELKQAG